MSDISTDAVARALPSRSLLEGIRVVEVSSRASGAYAGRLFSVLGASVVRYGPVLDLAAVGTVASLTEQWLHEGKTLGAASRMEPEQVVSGADLVLLEVDSADAEWRSWASEVEAAAGRRPSSDSVRPPVVLRVEGAVVDGRPIPSDALSVGAWSAMSWSIGGADREPLTLPFDLPDFQAALYGAAAGLATLLADPAAPDLRSVEVATRDVLAYYVGMITANFLPYERPWTRDGARPPGSAGVYPASIFPCADGHVVLMCRNQREWKALLAAMDDPEWARDARFDDPRVVARLHADEADSHLMPWVRGQTTEELMVIGQKHGLAVAPIRSMSEALEEPQFAERGFLGELPRAPRPVRVATVPWHLSEIGDAPSEARSWPVGSSATEPARLLEGLRVLDLSWVWSGPLTTSILSDLGAEVIKVEHEGHLDTGRLRGKARRGGVEVEGPEHEATPYFNQMNHGKRSITVDLKHPRARTLLLDLAEQCDVVVENMRPGALQRLGLSYTDFAGRNPSIVMLSMSMAGQEGPLRTMKGYAGIMAAMSGLESLIGYDEANIVGSLSPALGDPNAAGHALTVLLGALIRRRRTGGGAWIDLSQIEALLCALPAPVVQSQLEPAIPVPANSHPRIAPHGHFPCRGEDRWIALSVRDDDWSAFTSVAADAPFASEPRWSSLRERISGRSQLEAAVAEWSAGQERDELVDRLLSAGLPAAPVASFEELTDAAWTKERELTVRVSHKYLGDVEVFVVPWRFGGHTAGRAQPAPLLGADTDDVLQRLLALTPREIGELRADGVLR
ncbi:CoA transferase [Parafrankia sp. EUN1f]|uniref:CaiB/BaiF CoA-transferase family protein n=1 Tax=Parafrankia sp. EUN1f TaxID=102897 RepID=UPI0001C46FC7|nr:CoA transferase [Parafrankia sp. EUN1f]EFC86762.1 L-carnitine dehydratase/bile acid-inducible protein F [Parafrankia sp. EUN1f]